MIILLSRVVIVVVVVSIVQVAGFGRRLPLLHLSIPMLPVLLIGSSIQFSSPRNDIRIIKRVCFACVEVNSCAGKTVTTVACVEI